MTEQQPGGVPENFDAFARPEPAAGDTWVANPAYYAPIDPYGVEEAGEPAPPRPAGLRGRLAGLGKGKLIAGGVAVVLVVAGAVWGTSAALASSGPGPSSAAAAAPGGKASVPGKGARKAGAKNTTKLVKLKITSVAADSFVGTDAKGQSVTVAYGDSTHFGTKARPLSPDQLAVGMIVTVAGDRSDGSVDATAIVPAKAAAAGGSGGASDAPGDVPSDSASATADGNA